MSAAESSLPSEESSFAVRNTFNAEAMRQLATAAIGDSATLELVGTPIDGDIDAVNEGLASAATSIMTQGRRSIDRLQISTYEAEDGSVITTSTGAIFPKNNFYQPVYLQLDVIKSKPDAGKPPVPTSMTVTRIQPPIRTGISSSIKS